MTMCPVRPIDPAAAPGSAIQLDGFTKDYGHGRGVFDVTLTVRPGETVGFLGANGAGKTVTMRALMGFVRPGAGRVRIGGLDCFAARDRIQASLGYLPGEVCLPPDLRGSEFLDFMARMRGLADRRRCDELVERFELDPSVRIGRMSKGTKQKVALVCAFMGAPDVLLLDEPTSGFDPVMQGRFVDLVCEERARGATVLLSSHLFAEVERCCDRVALIRAGRLQAVVDANEACGMHGRAFTVAFADAAERARYLEQARCGQAEVPVSTRPSSAAATLEVEAVGSVDAFVKELAGYRVADLTSREQTLEDLFRRMCGDGEKAPGVLGTR